MSKYAAFQSLDSDFHCQVRFLWVYLSWARLPLGVLREITGYMSSVCNILPVLDEYSVKVFNLESQTWAPTVTFLKTIKYSRHSRYILLDSHRVFLCGGTGRC